MSYDYVHELVNYFVNELPKQIWYYILKILKYPINYYADLSYIEKGLIFGVFILIALLFLYWLHKRGGNEWRYVH